MGNTFSGISAEYLLQAEHDIVKHYAGMEPGEYTIEDLDISEELRQVEKEHGSKGKSIFNHESEDNFIHTINFFNNDPRELTKPRLLLIHGFMANGAQFAPMLKGLTDTYRVTTIDLLGLGSSGRPAFALTEVQDCIDFFTLSFEAWVLRTKFREEGPYTLGGHSFGAYISMNYAIRFPAQIEKIVMLSPAGVPQKPKEYDLATYFGLGPSIVNSVVTKFVTSIWGSQYSFISPLKYMGYKTGDFIIYHYYKSYYPTLNEADFQVQKEISI